MTRKGQAHEDQSCQHANNAFNITNVLGHDNSFKVKNSSSDAITSVSNGSCQSVTGLFGFNVHSVVWPVNRDFGLAVHSQQSQGHGLFAMAARHALNSENLVHDVPFS
jgi:hypothetical protein